VESWNNFPMSAGIASSASGFAALSLAASRAAGLQLDEISLSRLARKGSGSACRSIPGGFVEWQAGKSDQESYAFSIAPSNHWDIVDCIVVVSEEEKHTSSRKGHSIAHTSALQSARLADTAKRLESCRRAVIEQDFKMLAEVVEQDSNLMHAVMMTSQPPLIYWLPETLAVILAVKAMRNKDIRACYTIDAGPNVHVLCPEEDSQVVYKRMVDIRGVKKVLICHPGGPAVIE
jgi:diphosphomevalonate decarboxylase